MSSSGSRETTLREPLLSTPKPEPAQTPSAFQRVTDALSFNWIAGSLGGKVSLSHAMRLEGGLAEADEELQRHLQPRDRSLLACLVLVFWRSLARAAGYKLASDLVRYMPPLLLARLLVCLNSRCGDLEAYALAFALPLATLGQALLVNQYFWHALRTGVQVRGVLTSAIIRRALRYRRCDRADGGKLANLISSDCGRLNTACGSINMAWSAPLQLTLALGLLWRSLGRPVLGGLLVMVLLWPIQAAISRALAQQRSRTARATDERLQRTEAAFASSRAVKLEGWEDLCEAEVRDAISRPVRARP